MTVAASVAIDGSAETFAVRRIYCVGRNYAAHVREMGGDPAREAPFFFSKPADALTGNGGEVPYPPRTKNLHHEVELVVAIGRGGADIATGDALSHVFGYAVGNDLTRRDLQSEMRARGLPWEVAKGFDHSAPLAELRTVQQAGHPRDARIWLEVNGQPRQDARLTDMIWSVPEIIAELSTYFALAAGDLIFTGTPDGVGPLVPGDSVRAGIDGLGTLQHRIVSRA
ncbi:MAG: fumarylacetoacetate hydrolase family protein [Pseudomonadota bacterium]